MNSSKPIKLVMWVMHPIEFNKKFLKLCFIQLHKNQVCETLFVSNIKKFKKYEKKKQVSETEKKHLKGKICFFKKNKKRCLNNKR